jgi:eukaryotic-like serine/threonine-protein kinase
VFSAWDPELERRVALKLVRLSSAATRGRAMREGQILARLSHPNVVPVFDVGQVDDQLYLVMEFVRGTTLKELAASAPRPRVIVDAYQQAGAGLAAAHAIGVIHRDFKPSNAIRGDDGRVRVLDFGIANTGGGRELAGTPAYMAPEQREAVDTLTPAVDQFAFCVALREALVECGGVPAWIAAIVERGTRAAPDERFADFGELLDALHRDPARRRRRLAVAAGLAAAAVGVFVIGQRTSGEVAVEPCVGGASEIARAWNVETRMRLVGHLGTLGARGVTEGVRLANEIDRDALAWVAEHREACLANARKELSPARYDARLGCFARVRNHLASVADLVSTVDATGLDDALFAARMRPDVHGCADTDDAIVPPPAGLAPQIAAVVPQIEHALVFADAWRSEAVPLAATAVATARALGYQPLLARALLVQGRALMTTFDPSAIGVLAEAMRTALAASDDALAVEAYARWLYQRATTGKAATDNLEIMEEIAARLGPRGRFARALLYNNLGVARTMADDFAGARGALERAAAEHAQEIELASVGQNLASLESTPAAALARIKATHQLILDALGPAHARTIMVRMIVGLLTPDRTAARALFDCDQLGPALRPGCAYEAGWLADESGDLAAAASLMASARNESPPGQIASDYVALREGRFRAEERKELEQIASAPHVAAYERIYAADAALVLALASPSDAAWQRANDLAASVLFSVYSRRLARSDAELARRLAKSRPADAAAHAERALAWYGDAASDRDLAAQLAAIKSRRGSR